MLRISLWEKNKIKKKKLSWYPQHQYYLYATYNELKSVVAEKFIRTLKNKIYKHIAAASKNVCIDKLEDIVNQYKKYILYREQLKWSLLKLKII